MAQDDIPKDSDNSAVPIGPRELHDGAGPCGTHMTLADGTDYSCPYYCDLPADHSGSHSCSMYNHGF